MTRRWSRRAAWGAAAVLLLGAAAGLSVTRGRRKKPSSVVVRMPGLGDFVLRDHKDPIQAYLASGVTYDPESVAVFEAVVAAGMRVADIGAYNGVHSVRLANLVGPTGKVYAFEPNPPAYDMLAENIRLNALGDRVVAYRVGVSDKASSAHARVGDDPHNLGGTHMCTDEDVRTGRLSCARTQADALELVRIDDDPRRWFPERIDFVKVDIEGYEDRFLAGSRRWLAEDRPILYVEIWDDDKRAQERLPTSAQEVISRIEALGYTLSRRGGAWDYLFVPKAKPVPRP
ncbi:MAG: FkbM family methyltransferase [Elusimicrobia bacterium]|nr:FkbM family methyltransferase [Elusimicrobiota bacterium]